MRKPQPTVISVWLYIVPMLLSGISKEAMAQIWSLSNGVVSKTVVFSSADGLQVSSWKDLTTGYEFIRPGFIKQPSLEGNRCYEFQFDANHLHVSGKATDISLTSASTGVRQDGTHTLDISLAAKALPISVVVHYELGKNQPAIRQSLSITNAGSTPVVLQNLTVSCGFVPPGEGHDNIAYGGYGEQPRETYFTGRVDDVLVREENAKTGIGWAVLSEVPGYERRIEVGQAGQWTPSFAAMYDSDVFPFERTLAPGQIFDSAGVSLLFYQRGTSADPHWRIPQYVLSRIAHNTCSGTPGWIYNVWEPWRSTFKAQDASRILELAKENGFTQFTVDEGWESRLGDNEVNLQKFPEGLGPVFAKASSLGLRRGLWMPVSLINPRAQAYVEHPDWACHDESGRPRLSQGQGVVMCLASPYKYAVLQRVSAAVEKYQLNYIKLDLTTVFNTYGEEPGCYETGHDHKSSRESMETIYDALGWLAQSLHNKFPKLLIDYTFELWGQKHLIDYGLLKVADLDWLSNIADQTTGSPGPEQVRMLLYQRGMAIPAETMLIGNLQAETPYWQEHVATEMGSGPVFLGDLTKQTEAERKGYAEWIKRFTRLREEVPLNESFFPLGSWQQVRSDRWDGFARFSHHGEGLIVLFRNDSNATSANFSIPGFPSGKYKMIPWDSRKRTVVDGGVLQRDVRVRFSGKERVKVIEVRLAATFRAKVALK